MNILVRNLHRGVTENDLLQLFKPFGTIKSHNIVIDQSTGKSKGFGFVDMPDNSEAAAAIKALDGKLIRGLKIRVKASNARSFKNTANKRK
ncbi:MAG: RNA-binding protein [Nitrospirae bacterium]|nr:RNA-binding protein [Nitrospirota bacterium]